MIGNSNKKLFLLLLCVPLIGMGQDDRIYKSPFKIGLEFGPSITSVRGSLSSSELPNGQQVELYNNQTFCFSGGLSFEYSLQKRFSIKTNILYERKAAFMDITSTDPTGNVIGKYNPGYNYDYLTIPILAKYSFGEKTKLFFNTGPYFSYLINSILTYDGMSGGGIELIDEVTTNRFNRFDAGLTIGLGGKFKIQRKLLLTIEPRYNLGLTNIINEDNFWAGNPAQDGLHNTISLLVGISYVSGNIK